jgi:hypothetical protein
MIQVIGFVCLLGSLGVSVVAGEFFYRRRYTIGAALIGGGGFLVATGFALIWNAPL